MKGIWRTKEDDLNLDFVRREGDVGVFTVLELAEVGPPGGEVGGPPCHPPRPVLHVPLCSPHCLAWSPVSLSLCCLLSIKPP